MSIRDWGQKIKSTAEEVKEKLRDEKSTAGHAYYMGAIILLVGLSSFGLGRLSIFEESREPITIEDSLQAPSDFSSPLSSKVSSQTASVAQSTERKLEVGGKIIASKNGSKYYFPWCGSAQKILEANKIWFNSEAEARAKGYTPAANCKGLK